MFLKEDLRSGGRCLCRPLISSSSICGGRTSWMPDVCWETESVFKPPALWVLWRIRCLRVGGLVRGHVFFMRNASRASVPPQSLLLSELLRPHIFFTLRKRRKNERLQSHSLHTSCPLDVLSPRWGPGPRSSPRLRLNCWTDVIRETKWTRWSCSASSARRRRVVSCRVSPPIISPGLTIHLHAELVIGSPLLVSRQINRSGYKWLANHAHVVITLQTHATSLGSLREEKHPRTSCLHEGCWQFPLPSRKNLKGLIERFQNCRFRRQSSLGAERESLTMKPRVWSFLVTFKYHWKTLRPDWSSVWGRVAQAVWVMKLVRCSRCFIRLR